MAYTYKKNAILEKKMSYGKEGFIKQRLKILRFGFVTPKMPKNLYVKFFRREIKTRTKTLTMKNSRKIRNRAW